MNSENLLEPHTHAIPKPNPVTHHHGSEVCFMTGLGDRMYHNAIITKAYPHTFPTDSLHLIFVLINDYMQKEDIPKEDCIVTELHMKEGCEALVVATTNLSVRDKMETFVQETDWNKFKLPLFLWWIDTINNLKLYIKQNKRMQAVQAQIAQEPISGESPKEPSKSKSAEEREKEKQFRYNRRLHKEFSQRKYR